MAEKLPMLALSPTMEEGTIAKWRKQVGDEINPGDVLCDVETDKAVMEYEATTPGTLLKIIAEEGASVAVGEPIAVVGEAGESPDEAGDAAEAEADEEEKSDKKQPEPSQKASETDGKNQDKPAPAKPEEAAETKPEQPQDAAKKKTAQSAPPPASERHPVRSSPLARQLAEKHGLDIAAIEGSGPHGRVVQRDVEEAIAARSSAPPAGHATPSVPALQPAEDEQQPVSRKRQVIAQRLSESKFSAPHYYLTTSAAMDALMAARRQINDTLPEKLSLNAFIIKLAAEALKRHPLVNATWKGDAIIRHNRVDVALAVAQDDGLVTPVIRNCGQRGIIDIDRNLRQLVEKAHKNTLTPEEYSDSTFTITNLGNFDIEDFTAIINPPNSAILAIGKIIRTPVYDEQDNLRPRALMRMTLSCDHRIIDGAVGAAFLRDLKHMLESPLAALL